jgi:Ca2+-binding RTX toxin-like protein
MTSFEYETTLGPGADQYIGGPGPDYVQAGDVHRRDTADDVIGTAGGFDWVEIGGGADAVDLGSESDHLVLFGPPMASSVFTGGPGPNFLTLRLSEQDPHSWTVDNRAGRLLRDGMLSSRWDGFSRFELSVRGGPIKILGSDRGEVLLVEHPQWPLDVRMGGGDDLVQFVRGSVDPRFEGGEGTDKLTYVMRAVAFPRVVDIDLSRGVLRDTRQFGRAATSSRAVNFENAKVYNPTGGRTLITGTRSANSLRAKGETEATIFGRGGADLLVGSNHDDVLIGGHGRDTANGWLGTDHCEAEVRVDCEN